MTPTVYLVTNRTNGHTYVGVSRFDPSVRWTQHVQTATRAPRSYLHWAIARYGADAFTVEPVASCLSVSAAGAVERAVIERLRPTYNQTNGGEITHGRRIPPAIVEQIRQKNTGQKRTPEQLANMSRSRKALYDANPEYRAKATEAIRKARAFIDQEKRRAAAARALAQRVWTPESRAKLSRACMGRRQSREVLDRMAAKHRKPVRCVTTGAVYPSMMDAARETGLSVSGVSKVCLGQRAQANGLVFEICAQSH